MTNTEKILIDCAIDSLINIIPFAKIQYKGPGDSSFQGYDGIVDINGKEFVVLTKSTVTSASISSIQKRFNQIQEPINKLLIAGQISSAMMERLRESSINVLESTGNCMIYVPSDLYLHIVRNTGSRVPLKSSNMGFRDAGAAVLFTLLSRIDTKIPTLRKLSELSLASVGTVKHVLDTLQANHYVFDTPNGRFLKDRPRLLEEWVTIFNQQIRGSLVFGHAMWVGDSKDWKTVSLPEGAIWGGEAGAFLVNGYLTPASFCIYGDFRLGDLVKSKYIIPNNSGDIVLYRKFWAGELSEEAQALLFYADLLNTGNSRCIEAAELLRNERLSYII